MIRVCESIAPIVLGAGRSLSGGLEQQLRLMARGSDAIDDGLVRMTCDVVRQRRPARRSRR